MAIAAGASASRSGDGRPPEKKRRSVVLAVAGCVMVFALLGLGFKVRTAALEAASLDALSLPAVGGPRGELRPIAGRAPVLRGWESVVPIPGLRLRAR